MKYSAAVSWDRKNQRYHIEIRRGVPKTPPNHELIEVLYGDDEDELKHLAKKYVQEQLPQSWPRD